ncbi:hypothetical protein ANN_20068 [Periplaneta americana]|uniref:Uncharacterized protein n=1 Tax=Periplaneta americana TaxID=6978 RepID=A0ABQ8SBT6_PERAM|nr:hypothetical protein ANN_20068 [Periplaneta americana]
MAGLCEGGNEPPDSLKASHIGTLHYRHVCVPDKNQITIKQLKAESSPAYCQNYTDNDDDDDDDKEDNGEKEYDIYIDVNYVHGEEIVKKKMKMTIDVNFKGETDIGVNADYDENNSKEQNDVDGEDNCKEENYVYVNYG